ncbi:MAG: metal ABC transporter permease [Elusimicrobia bacterium]|nr:metal ABC transporter permease [Candidatus Obscuribacterium magneticum]MCB4755853.1 metal ABC transporter permease [Candidatus Obscuribacterium magneticum]
MLDLMILPFLACLILTGIHAYLGVHVIERGVIFVDLALAQIAALGSVAAIGWGFSLHTPAAYLMSLGFTFVGAAIFSFTRLKESDIPQEAVIGIVYVVSAAAAVLVLDRIPSEAQHIKDMLVGNILFVDWPHIWRTFLLYSGIGVLHFLFRKRFILISCQPEEAEKKGISIRWWDFLFYMSFGVVVTSSVDLAGVLLVFSFLIIPAVCAILFTKNFGKRLTIGWILGAATSLAGVYASAAWDFPTGAAVVCAFGLLAICCGIVKSLLKQLAVMT